MSRKHCRRKIYALVDPIQYAITGARITPRAKLDSLLLRELSSLDCIANGTGSIHHWHYLRVLNNIAQEMIIMGIGPEAYYATQRLEKELIAAALRYDKTKRMGLSGPGIVAAREVIDWHDAQRSVISLSKYEEAIRRTISKEKSGQLLDVGDIIEKEAA